MEAVTNEAPNFDFETKVVAIAIAPGEAYCLSKENLKYLKDALAGEAVKVGHQLKASLLALRKEGFDCGGPLFDTQVAHYLIEPEASHELSILANQYLGTQLIESYDPVKNVCERADAALQIKKHLTRELESRNQTNLMTAVEMPLIRVLAEMEFEGVTIDTGKLGDMSDELKKDSQRLQGEIFEMAGMEFNIASPKQLGEVLFDKMRLLDKAKKTKTGQYATGEDILTKLAGEHEIAKKILDFREDEKLRSTYVDVLPRMISRFDGRVHTDYRQAVAATGRLSSNNPNLQNIPIRTGKGKRIREAFVARDKEHLILSADYSQIELRLAAVFAKDATMLEAFKNGRDIHTTTASKVFKVDIKEVTSDMRRKAKEVNFGILYGSTAFGLAQNIGISKTEAAEIIEAYFKEFSTIKKYMDDSINFAREHEYVETLLGRRRYLRDIHSRNQTTRGFAERNAINAPIQGSAADIIKLAMLNIQQWVKQEKLKSKMIMQVHDELVFDVHKEEADLFKEHVPWLMKTAVQLDVTLDAEVAVAENWFGAHG
ncbi:MAG: DNA polymerase I [Candidatus Nephrothrix sp. EaCA]|nr:MAG: DNA polymerase I [Candidatus Nephrothrix sp. EaCA]